MTVTIIATKGRVNMAVKVRARAQSDHLKVCTRCPFDAKIIEHVSNSIGTAEIDYCVPCFMRMAAGRLQLDLTYIAD